MGSSEPGGARKLGAYTLGRKLGAGGMATVYAARQEGAHVRRLVALKVLSATISPDDPEHDAFLREAHIATRLEHPNIVRTYDVGEVGGTMFLAMELVHGASLSACQKNNTNPLPVEIALRVVADVAGALHAAHDLSDPESGHLGFVHQDVSPQNILIGYDGRVKLVDFGVARLATLEGSRTETVRGKPSYLSPEQVNGKHIDRRTDVFALGIVFWELLTGARLFKRDSSAAAYLAVLQEPAPYVRTINTQVPAAIADIVARALEKDRDARFDTAAAMRKALLGARAVCGIPDVSEEDVAVWLASRVPPTTGPADLEREIVTESTRQVAVSMSPPRLGLAGAPSLRAGPTSHISVGGGERTEVSDVMPDAPDLDFAAAPRSSRPQLAAAAVPESTARMMAAPHTSPPSSAQMKVPTLDVFKPGSVSAAPVITTAAKTHRAPPIEAVCSGRLSGTPAPSSGRSVGAPPAPGVSFDDDDDFDMQIERNLTGASMAPAMSSRPSGHSAQSSGRPSGARVASTGLELGARTQAQIHRSRGAEETGARAKAAGFGVAALTFAATMVVLARFVHRAGGISVGAIMPHAFDGSSVPDSGAVAVGAIVVASALGFAGLRVTPRSWAILASGCVMLLLGLAMVTVTLASSGENPTPPDGARLVPYFLPLATVLLAFGVAGSAASLFARGGVSRRVASVPVAVVAGAIAFIAYELSPLVQ